MVLLHIKCRNQIVLRDGNGIIKASRDGIGIDLNPANLRLQNIKYGGLTLTVRVGANREVFTRN